MSLNLCVQWTGSSRYSLCAFIHGRRLGPAAVVRDQGTPDANEPRERNGMDRFTTDFTDFTDVLIRAITSLL